MRRDLDNILSGVGVGSWKRCDQHFIEPLLAIEEGRQMSDTRLLLPIPDVLTGNRKRVWSAQADYGNCSSTRWAGDRDDGVVDQQPPIIHPTHAAVGSTKVVPGSRIFTAGWSG